MKKWENEWCFCESLLALSENCNDRGQERWEVVSVFFNGKDYVAWLKREIPESPAEKENDAYIAPHDGMID